MPATGIRVVGEMELENRMYVCNKMVDSHLMRSSSLGPGSQHGGQDTREPHLFPKPEAPRYHSQLLYQSPLPNPNKMFLKLDHSGEWGLGIRDPIWRELMGLRNAPNKVMASGRTARSGIGAF